MTISVDGTPASIVGSSGSSFSIGPLSTTFANGYAILAGMTTGINISSISGGGLNFTSRSTSNPGPTQYIEEWVAPISVPLSSVSLTVNFPSSCSFITYVFFAVSNAGVGGIVFDVGGPQTNPTAAASMTTSETAFVVCYSRFTNPTNAPSASSPWSGIFSGVANSFFGIESQIGGAGSYTGLFSGTSYNGSIIDAMFEVQYNLTGQSCQ